ncbi:putative lipoprotein [Myxococcus xanthus DK 1622]|uniref:Lipoprotein n=2 Tax=Myxococcaceae TaxID=31 RepID=Q1DE03_MYXXD|nr:putative lipoprotein [Myxococcus xanthus DK 1622]NOJ55867.1 hypothetical protein [Myxococcus xanthus]QPM80524.1 hypothetical protein I5Q59_04280 [Myxococcus xanthus]QVW69585.1 hypothetical protein JTM82_08570 [Myxococcus xanthus DZ2]UEO04287.1 hypothetical protein K1515_34240 [Myxococcus xanthus DZ2]
MARGRRSPSSFWDVHGDGRRPMRFRAGWLLAGAAALMLGTACEERDRGTQGQASGQSAVNDQVPQAQQEAQRKQSDALAQQNQQARQQSEQLRQQAQQPGAVAPEPQGAQAQQGSEQQIVGEVLSANDDELLLSSQGEPQLRLQVSPQTQVMVDGRQASAGEIQEGSQVRASYRTDEQSGEPQAVRIEATSQVQPTAPAAPESGQSTPGSQQPTQ